LISLHKEIAPLDPSSGNGGTLLNNSVIYQKAWGRRRGSNKEGASPPGLYPPLEIYCGEQYISAELLERIKKEFENELSVILGVWGYKKNSLPKKMAD